MNLPPACKLFNPVSNFNLQPVSMCIMLKHLRRNYVSHCYVTKLTIQIHFRIVGGEEDRL